MPVQEFRPRSLLSQNSGLQQELEALSLFVRDSKGIQQARQLSDAVRADVLFICYRQNEFKDSSKLGIGIGKAVIRSQ